MSLTAHEETSIKQSGRDALIPYRALLWFCTAVFAARVIMQPLAAKWEVSALPSFDAWHSEVVPYSVLLGLQLTIIVVMILGIQVLPRIGRKRRAGWVVGGSGWMYGCLMVGRTIVGSFNLNAHSWFDGAVPTAFHFVLVFYIMTIAHALSGQRSGMGWVTWSRYLGYPILIVGSLMLFFWMRTSGSPLLFSSYVSVLIGALGVIMHESFNPARDEWRPESTDVVSDGVFLIVVQVGIPAALKVLLPAVIITFAGNSVFNVLGFWPHEWPILWQAGLMLLIAEFFRYWIHRSMHEFNPLWKLHAVHHASDKL